MTQLLRIALLVLAVFTLPATAAAKEQGEKSAHGAPVGEGEALPLSKILAAPDSFAGKNTIVEGKVRAVCKKRGCWMELATDDGKSCRVTFKDYGFFVPKDADGASARLEGVVQVKTLSKAEVEHYEAEGGKFAKAEDGTAREVRIVASGVELAR